jgi:tRNA threonylcarbamoyladenosine biosynthesis protein TsaE
MSASVNGDLRLSDEAATTRLGAAIAIALGRGEAVCLTGPLGAGKSSLARGLIRALAPEAGDVPSPTFTLVQFYAGPDFEIAHFDLYRLTRAEEAFEIGLDEALREGAAVIEWPERLGDLLPADRLEVVLRVDGEGRRAGITAHGAWEGRALDL